MILNSVRSVSLWQKNFEAIALASCPYNRLRGLFSVILVASLAEG